MVGDFVFSLKYKIFEKKKLWNYSNEKTDKY